MEKGLRELAPIGIGTYSRKEHLKQTIKALQKNTLAQQSILYIFSDAAQKGDEGIVSELRDYAHNIDGFKRVYVVERSENGRVENNRGGQRHLLDLYGKCIFMEDDIVTAPGFLAFMNEALDYYENDKRILSITGYSLPIKALKDFNDDVFVLPRFNGWGVGLWQKKYEKVSYFSYDEYLDFRKDNHSVNRFLSGGGEDMLPMLKAESQGIIDAFDVKAMFHQYKNNMLTVYPKKSLVQNIGHDGSGVHCGTTNKFHHKKLWSKVKNFKFVKSPQVDERIRKANFKFRSRGLKGKLADLSRKAGIYPMLKSLKDKIK